MAANDNGWSRSEETSEGESVSESVGGRTVTRGISTVQAGETVSTTHSERGSFAESHSTPRGESHSFPTRRSDEPEPTSDVPVETLSDNDFVLHLWLTPILDRMRRILWTHRRHLTERDRAWTVKSINELFDARLRR